MINNLLILIVCGMFKRIPWVKRKYDGIKQTIREKYDKTLDLEKARLRNYNHIELFHLNYQDHVTGVSLKIERAVVKLNIFKWRDSIKCISSLKIHNAELNLTGRPPTGPSATNTSPSKKIERLYRTVSKKLTRFIDLLPDSIELTNIKCLVGGETSAHIEHVVLKDRLYSVGGYAVIRGTQESLKTTGNLNIVRDGGNIKVDIHGEMCLIHHSKPDAVEVRANKVDSRLCYRWNGSDMLDFELAIAIPEFIFGGKQILHRAAGSEGGSMSVTGVIDRSGLRINECSQLTFNHLKFAIAFIHPTGTDSPIEMKITMKHCSMEQLLSSFPDFYYQDIYTASYSGGLGFNAVLKLRLAPHVDFGVKVRSDQDIIITNKGRLDLDFLKSPFIHQIYDQGIYIRELELDDRNNDYVPLDSCSACFKQAIVTTEDPDFFTHKGINFHSLGIAFIGTLGTLKFTRGGSSITIQLARNLFLRQKRSPNKKIEEFFLAWLMEEVFAVPKNRLLEIYLNIIEFAPGIYGIGAAAEFYFGKTAGNLSLLESMTLTYIVPRPKYFIDALNNGSLILAENLERHLRVVAGEMLQRGYITGEDLKMIGPRIDFKSGLGKIFLNDKFCQLHPILSEAFKTASMLWTQRYSSLPRPYISHTHHTTTDKDNRGPHDHFPSLAFDILFKDYSGSVAKSASLFKKFADLITEVDKDNHLTWSGNSDVESSLSHFELANWRELSADTTKT